MEKLSL